VVNQAYDLTINKEQSASVAMSGDTITYTITYENLGPAVATEVEIMEAYPSNFTF